MKRWHLTLGLAGAAVVAAALAPRLTALWTAPAPPPSPAEVHPSPAQVQTPAASHQGRLVVEAGLDRTAVLKGRTTERFLTIRVTAPPDQGQPVRQAVNLAVVMDVSGSMSAAGKIDHARQAARSLARAMGPDDTFSLIAFNDEARVVVPAGPITDLDRVLRQIDRVYEGGGTNLYAGMTLGDAQVQTMLDAGEVGRVVVLSDGNANVGVTSPTRIASFAATAAAKGVTVSTLGLGLDYNEDMLARIADLGGGSYAFVDKAADLSAVFADELTRVSSVVARGTTVSIELPPHLEPIEVIGWETHPTDSGWTVFLGDVHAGAQRKIVTRVRVHSATEGMLTAAQVRADYLDLVDQAPAYSTAQAKVQITTDPNQVASSLNALRSADAHAAWGNRFLELSTRAYADGKVEQAQRVLAEGASVLRSAAGALGEERLTTELQAFERQMDVYNRHEPASASGRHAIKRSKETARDAYR